MAKRRLRLSREPETESEQLAERVREYLYLPDPSLLYVTIASLVANMLEGGQCWTMLVGQPGSGKTEMLLMLSKVPHVHAYDSIEGKGAFLSGTGASEISKSATGGILKEVGKHGCILIKDFTSMFAMGVKEASTVLDVFRQMYDGRWSRPVGTDGGKRLTWEGRMGFLAASTGQIDQYQSLMSMLGERYIYWRMDINRDIEHEMTRRRLMLDAHPGWKEELHGLVAGFIESLGLRFGRNSIVLAPRRVLEDREGIRIQILAEVAATCRSSAPRDHITKEICGVPERENSTRIATSLSQLYVALELIGVPEVLRWRILRKVTMDSMPKLKQIIVQAAGRNETGTGEAELAASIGCSKVVIERAVRELEIHGVLTRRMAGKGFHKGAVRWVWSEWMEFEMRRFYED